MKDYERVIRQKQSSIVESVAWFEAAFENLENAWFGNQDDDCTQKRKIWKNGECYEIFSWNNTCKNIIEKWGLYSDCLHKPPYVYEKGSI